MLKVLSHLFRRVLGRYGLGVRPRFARCCAMSDTGVFLFGTGLGRREIRKRAVRLAVRALSLNGCASRFPIGESSLRICGRRSRAKLSLSVRDLGLRLWAAKDGRGTAHVIYLADSSIVVCAVQGWSSYLGTGAEFT